MTTMVRAGLTAGSSVVPRHGTARSRFGFAAREAIHRKGMTMMRTAVTSAVAGALLLGLATAAYAVTGEFNNMCAEGLALHE